MRWLGVVLVACAKPEAAQPSTPSPVTSVSVAPQSTGSPDEPALLVGPAPTAEPPGDVERVKVQDERPDAGWKPPKDRCPEGVTEMMAVHLPLRESMELAAGATPISALGSTPDAVDVIFDRKRQIVRVTAQKYGLVFVLVERAHKCTLYGVGSGY